MSASVYFGFLPHPLAFIQPHLIGYHRDELTVGGLTAQVMDGIAEVAIEGIHISPIPCNLDGVADGALYAAVVPFFLAISGYRRLVTALMYSGSFMVSRMASRRNW